MTAARACRRASDLTRPRDLARRVLSCRPRRAGRCRPSRLAAITRRSRPIEVRHGGLWTMCSEVVDQLAAMDSCRVLGHAHAAAGAGPVHWVATWRVRQRGTISADHPCRRCWPSGCDAGRLRGDVRRVQLASLHRARPVQRAAAVRVARLPSRRGRRRGGRRDRCRRRRGRCSSVVCPSRTTCGLQTGLEPTLVPLMRDVRFLSS